MYLFHPQSQASLAEVEREMALAHARFGDGAMSVREYLLWAEQCLEIIEFNEHRAMLRASFEAMRDAIVRSQNRTPTEIAEATDIVDACG